MVKITQSYIPYRMYMYKLQHFMYIFFYVICYREHPGAGNIITFMQFLFVAVEGFIFTVQFGTKKCAIPLK